VGGEGEDRQARHGDGRGADQRVLGCPEGVQDHGHDERADELQDLAPAAGGGPDDQPG
jgi:hypothetical protein